MKKHIRWSLIHLIIAIIIWACTNIAIIINSFNPKPTEISYSQIIHYIINNEATALQAKEGSTQVTIILKSGNKYISRVPNFDYISEMISKKNEEGSEIELKFFPKSNYLMFIIIIELLEILLIGLSHKKYITDKANQALPFSLEDMKILAIHEAGHAIVSAILRPNVINLGIKIATNTNARSYNKFSKENTLFYKKQNIFLEICVFYAGRIAEEIILEDIRSGSTDDFNQATILAHKMVKFSMCNIVHSKIPDDEEFNKQVSEKNFLTVEKFVMMLIIKLFKLLIKIKM